MAPYYLYILRCFDGTFYVGVTDKVDRRFAEHSDGHDPESYTYWRRPLQLAFVQEFQWIEEAIAFEKKLKRWGHRKKRAFVEKRWADLKRYARGPNASQRRAASISLDRGASLDSASLRS